MDRPDPTVRISGTTNDRGQLPTTVQAPGRSLNGLEAVTVHTCLEASHALTTHPVHVLSGTIGDLETSWTWSQVGQHQVCFLLLVCSFLPCLPYAVADLQGTGAAQQSWVLVLRPRVVAWFLTARC